MTIPKAARAVLYWLAVKTKTIPAGLTSVSSRGGWWPIVRESFAGAWQTNVDVVLQDVLTHPTVFACFTLIAFDVAKLRVRLVEQQAGDIWTEVESASFSPFLRKPNAYQNRIQFYQCWMLSKLIQGNTYVLKQRDNRGVVIAGHILDPNRVRPLIAPNGEVFYDLSDDLLAQVNVSAGQKAIAPASEIIHDMYAPLYHPLVGIGPIHAAGVAATQALHIQSNSTNFFANGALPGGLLLHPGALTQTQADDLKAAWQTNYSGENAGKVAVLGGGLKYEPLQMMKATDGQVVEQLQWSDEKICSVCHVPGFKVDVGEFPPYNSAVQLNQDYYSRCIQIHLEAIELLLDEGLGLAPQKVEGRTLGTEFDVDGLVRMDRAAQIESESKAVGGGLETVNEARQRLNLGPKAGGNTIFLQQQNWPIEQLAEREPPTDSLTPQPPAAQPRPDESEDNENEEKSARRALLFHKAQQRLRAA